MTTTAVVGIDKELEVLLEDAVGRGVAPGLIACVFNADRVLAQAACGTRDTSSMEPMTLDTTVWMASKSKAVASMAALICVEKFGIDMDSHDDLAKVLPELAIYDDSRPSNKLFADKDSQGQHRYKRATIGLTLRHLLTHTAGYGAPTFHKEVASLYQPNGPLPPYMSGALAAIDTPRLFEAGTAWRWVQSCCRTVGIGSWMTIARMRLRRLHCSYGLSADWVGVFVERLTQLPLRNAYQELVFKPLNITQDELDTNVSAEMQKNRAAVHLLNNDGSFQATQLPFVFFESKPPDGFATLASGPLHGTVQGFVKFAQALLRGTVLANANERLITQSLFDEAVQDSLAEYGLSLPKPVLMTSASEGRAKEVVGPYHTYNQEDSSDLGESWSLFQAVYNRTKTDCGHLPGTIAWSGLANSFYSIDRATGIGTVIIAQVLPWMHPAMRNLRDQFETWAYKEMGRCKAPV